MKLHRDENNQYAGSFLNIASGHTAFTDFFDDPRHAALGISTDGASISMSQEGDMWVWGLTTYNLPIAAGRYRRKFQFILLVSYGVGPPSNLESFRRSFDLSSQHRSPSRPQYVLSPLLEPRCLPSIPNAPAILKKASNLIDTSESRRRFPSFFGTFPRPIYEKHNTNYHIHEWLTVTIIYSLVTLHKAGMPKEHLEHWAHFVRIVLLVFDRTPADKVHLELISRLTDNFNQGQESLYVWHHIDNIEAMPLSVHHLYHLADAIFLTSNLTLVWQLPLQCQMTALKLLAKSSKNPFTSINNKVRLRLCRCRGRDEIGKLHFADNSSRSLRWTSSRLSTPKSLRSLMCTRLN
jgi:hypothetical protein